MDYVKKGWSIYEMAESRRNSDEKLVPRFGTTSRRGYEQTTIRVVTKSQEGRPVHYHLQRHGPA
eukprot:14270888-Heterocapsa_arctica.AAC.1